MFHDFVHDPHDHLLPYHHEYVYLRSVTSLRTVTVAVPFRSAVLLSVKNKSFRGCGYSNKAKQWNETTGKVGGKGEEKEINRNGRC